MPVPLKKLLKLALKDTSGVTSDMEQSERRNIQVMKYIKDELEFIHTWKELGH